MQYGLGGVFAHTCAFEKKLRGSNDCTFGNLQYKYASIDNETSQTDAVAIER